MAKNKNLWSNGFTKEELGLYESLAEKDIQIILDYQEQLPILQSEDENKIDARCLHKQLEVKRDFSTWIKSRIKKYDFEEEIDYFKVDNDTHQNGGASWGGSNKVEYLLTLEMAKQLSMIENNEIGRNSRKYFIVIEKAFKERIKWNKTRQNSIDTFYDLKKTITADTYGDNVLGQYVPHWWDIFEQNGKKSALAYELYCLDLVIINQSATTYRKQNKLNPKEPIRNTFTESQLDDFEVLQSKSAEYIEVNGVWNTKERHELLAKFYEYYKEKKINRVA